jgi:WD40 repeat protein
MVGNLNQHKNNTVKLNLKGKLYEIKIDLNQPRVYDAVKGGQTPHSVDSAILGGLEGVKSRLASVVEEQRIAALSEALKYGEVGVYLVVQALLWDESKQVQRAAYLILRERTEPRVKQAIQQYNSWQLLECLYTFELPTRTFHLLVSPDGQTLVSCGEKGTIYLWNLHTGELLHTLSLDENLQLWECISCGISLDGQTHVICSASGITIKLWNLHTGKLLHTLNEGSYQIRANHPFFGGDDSITDFTAHVTALTISPDGQTLVSCSRSNVREYARQTEVLNPHTGVRTWTSSSLSYSNQDESLLKLWNLQTGELKRTFKLDKRLYESIAISPDEQTLLARSRSTNTIQLWNLHTGEVLWTIEGTPELVHIFPISPTISPNWQTIVTTDGDGNKLWNLHTGELIHTLHTSSPQDGIVKYFIPFAITPDEQTLVGSYYGWRLDLQPLVDHDLGTIKVWNLRTGELLHTLHGHSDSGMIKSFAISPDGQTIVSSGTNDKTIKLWNLHSGELLHTLHGHSDQVPIIRISPDGQTLISSTIWGEMKVWGLR